MVTDWLGQGGMGVVLKAFDETSNRHVAIKLMAPDGRPTRRLAGGSPETPTWQPPSAIRAPTA
jgi:serine/threonine protein kinase